MGAQLYQTIFPAPIRSLLASSIALTSAKDMGLRLRIFLNPQDRAARFLQGLPWELLFCTDTSEFLSLSRSTPVVRSLVVPRPERTVEFSGNLRILAAQAAPCGVPMLDLERELREMASAGGRGRVEVLPWKARLSELRETLDRHGPFDILHFLGHGNFLSDPQEGVLLFEGVGGRIEAVSGASLAVKLRDFSNLQLIVLNACKTAISTTDVTGAPFGGVAAALVQTGFPAVLAMQEVISDPSAIALSRTLYKTLANGHPIEVATAEARHAVFDLNPASFEWAIPCLFLRTSSNHITDPLPPIDLVKAGVDLFLSGDYRLARNRLAQVPGSEKAQLFDTLSRMALGAPLPTKTALDIDSLLQRLRLANDSDVARLSTVALGILRHDVIEPRYLRAQGIRSALLYSELESRSEKHPIEREVALALGASRDAMLRFKLRY